MNKWGRIFLGKESKPKDISSNVEYNWKVGMPHCDSAVLHAPGECEYCDHYPEWQRAREMWNINFTGHHEANKTTCPSEMLRSYEVINMWAGNRAK